MNPVICVTDFIGKMHATHQQADEPQEIAGLVADCVNGTADDAQTCKFIAGVRESTLSGIRLLLSMCEASPETMAALSTAASMLDSLSNIPGLMG